MFQYQLVSPFVVSAWKILVLPSSQRGRPRATRKSFPQKWTLSNFFSLRRWCKMRTEKDTHTPPSLFFSHSFFPHTLNQTRTPTCNLSNTLTHMQNQSKKKTKSWVSAHFYLTFKPASSPKPSSFSFFLSLLVQMTAASKKPLQSLSVIMCLPVRTMVVRAQFDFCSPSLPLFCNRSGSSFILWAHFIRMRLKSVPRSKQNEWPKSRQV